MELLVAVKGVFSEGELVSSVQDSVEQRLATWRAKNDFYIFKWLKKIFKEHLMTCEHYTKFRFK